MAEHSKLMSPSASGLWIPCTAMPQAKIDEGILDERSEAADRGTLQHTASEQLHRDGVIKQPELLTFDELEEVNKAVEMVDKVLYKDRDCYMIWYEMAVKFSDVWRADCFGTADIVALDLEDFRLYVLDYKFGRVQVNPVGNSQLMIYALAAIECLEAINYTHELLSATDIDMVHIGVIQPKTSSAAGVVPIHKAGLKDWDEKTLKPAQKAITTGVVEFVPGPYCGEKYCKVGKAGKCKALISKTEAIMEEFILDGAIESPVTPERVMAGEYTKLMEWTKTIEVLLASVWAESTKLAKDGQLVEGFKLVRGKGSRGWVDETMGETFLKNQKFKLAERVKTKPLTFPQAEKLMKESGKFDNARSKKRFYELCNHVEGKLVLASVDDARAEVSMVNTDQMIEEEFLLNSGVPIVDKGGPQDDDLMSMLTEVESPPAEVDLADLLDLL